MSARTLLTFEQFEQHYDDDGLKHELLEGDLITVPPSKYRHVVVREELAEAIRPYVKQHNLGRVYVRAGFKLSSTTWLQPDASFIRTAHLDRTDPDGYFEGAPAIAIEIASDSNSASHLDRKIEQYFAHGSEEVWVVYPETRKIRIHLPDGTSRTAGDELKSAALPGWSVGLTTIFDA